MSNATVVFKGTKEGIVILLDDNVSFEEIRNALKQKMSDSRNFFGDSSVSIVFRGRELSLSEEKELIKIITNAGAKLKMVTVGSSDTETDIPANEMPFTRNSIHVSALQNDTIYHRGSLRGGQSIKHSGSVVIVGDVNPGGEIIAEGNIIVLGSLKGVAHAGSKGNRNCFVAAIHMMPSQLRIADIITSIAEEMSRKKSAVTVPTYAYIHEGQIYIAPLV